MGHRALPVDSMKPELAKCQISRDYMVSAAEQACLNLTCLQIRKQRVTSDVAHLLKNNRILT